jgi:hypothetical protein
VHGSRCANRASPCSPCVAPHVIRVVDGERSPSTARRRCELSARRRSVEDPSHPARASDGRTCAPLVHVSNPSID